MLILFFTPLVGAIDLEEYPSDFVLGNTQVLVPGYPYAFNPSIIRWEGRLLMSFRVMDPISASATSSRSRIGLVWLDESFRAASTPQILMFNEPNLHPEDGRLIACDDALYLIYNGTSNQLVLMYVAQLEYDGLQFQIIHNECLSTFDEITNATRQKNWVPFVFENSLHLAYKLRPHTIFKPLLDQSGICNTISSTNPSLVWDWGEMRGGTQALPLDESTNLAFFHSSQMLKTTHSNNQSVPHYFIGAYTFSNKSPFRILQMSPEPIVGEGFYSGKAYEPYWHPVQAVFPCGFIMDESSIWISYGRQDHECWIVELDRGKLLESLISFQP